MQFWRFLGSLCVICLFLFTNANPFSLPRGMPLFDMVDMNKDGVITNEEGLTHPNKAIVKQWLLLLKKIPKRALQDGLTRKEYYKLLSKQYTCQSETCNLESRSFLDIMNMEADPCEDFSEFACGKFYKNKDHLTSWLGNIPQTNTLKVGKILLENENKDLKGKCRGTIRIPDEDFELDKKLRIGYQSCMNKHLIAKRGLEPLKQTLKDIGGWPILEQDRWNKTWRKAFDEDYEWHKQILLIENQGYYKPSRAIIKYDVQPDPRDRSKSVLLLEGQDFDEFSRRPSIKDLAEGIDNKEVQWYFENMINVSNLLGASSEQARLELKDSLLFEIELAKLKENAKHYYHKQIHQYDARKWQKETHNESLYTYLDNIPKALGVQSGRSIAGHPPDWTIFFRTWLDKYGVVIQGNASVILPSKEYLVNISEILQKYKSKPRVIANYLGWRVVEEGLEMVISQDVRSMQLQNASSQSQANGESSLCPSLAKVHNSSVVSSDMWFAIEPCVYYLGFSGLGANWNIAAGSLYVRAYLGTSYKKTVSKLVANVRRAISQLIRAANWMSNKTKQNALIKLDSMKEVVAFPTEFVNKPLMDEYYKDLVVSEDDFYGNMARAGKIVEKFRIQQTWQNNDFKYLEMNIMEANARYVQESNKIIIPAGIMQSYYFDPASPNNLNYGGIGEVIGHEITHGFDSAGHKFDENGDLLNWWDNNTLATFWEGVKCIVDHYEEFYYKRFNVTVDGTNIAGENIADSGGLKGAYVAYVQWLKNNGEERRLPGLDFTSRQMFWIGYARQFCYRVPYEYEKWADPMKYRIDGVLQNNEDFAKDFECILGSKMNPKKKCIVW